LFSFQKREDKNTSIQYIEGKNWMSFIGDQRPLNFMSIPGSHDAGALYNYDLPIIGTVTYAQTQNKSIKDQLNFGVRFLDIRCKNDSNGNFQIFHGSTDQKQTFDSVLNTCKEFLKNNPSETIIMSVREENSSSGGDRFYKDFMAYSNKSEYENLFYLDNYIPTLGEVRGKIVLIRRFYSESKCGINTYSSAIWPDNAMTSTINSDGVKFYFQDAYTVKSNAEKFQQIFDTNELSKDEKKLSRDKRMFYFNFTSGQTGSGNKIKNVSNYINPKLIDYYMQSDNKNNFYGMVITDFMSADLASVIYMTNF